MKKTVLSALILLGVLMCLPIAALAADRFVDNNNGTVTDTRTGLIWLKYANLGNEQTWNNAGPNCSSLASGQALLTDGSTAGQWRLPSKEELEGIGTDPPATWESGNPPVAWTMPGTPFTNVQSGYYWSGTSYGDVTTDGAWKVYMSNGLVDSSFKSASNYVWPVRVGDSGPVDECAQKIPVPNGQGFSPDITALPVLGADPENISPLGFGNIAEGGKDFTLSVGLCPFEVPMTFLFGYGWNTIPYFIDSDNKVINYSISDNMTDIVLQPSKEIEDYLWRINVAGKISEEIPGDFGGLFVDTKHLPRGGSFLLYAFPLGAVPSNGGDNLPIYMWTYDLDQFVDVSCEGKTPQPEGKEIFFVKPAAVPVTGTDPKKIQPFSVGPYALGGNLLAMSVDFCQFDGWVDTHFGIYCPSEDLFNIYFLNGEAETEQDMFQKVSLLKFLFAGELPPFAESKDWDYDNMQPYPTDFFKGTSSGLPKKRCYYIAAVSPAGVRDKFYAWIVALDVNLKDEFTKSLIKKHK